MASASDPSSAEDLHAPPPPQPSRLRDDVAHGAVQPVFVKYASFDESKSVTAEALHLDARRDVSFQRGSSFRGTAVPSIHGTRSGTSAGGSHVPGSAVFRSYASPSGSTHHSNAAAHYDPRDLLDTVIQGTDFLITHFLGIGSYGAIFCARNDRLDDTVAAKSISMLADLSEVKTLMAVQDNPGVIRVHQIIETTDIRWILMDLADTDLYDVIKDGIDYDSAISVFRQIVRTISLLHKAGVAHRDIKPDNILAIYSVDQITCKLADFGLATFDRKSTNPCGTKNYVSPENYSGSYDTFANDVWALGVLLVNLITGRGLPSPERPTSHIEHSTAVESLDICSRDLLILKRIFVPEDERIACDEILDILDNYDNEEVEAALLEIFREGGFYVLGMSDDSHMDVTSDVTGTSALGSHSDISSISTSTSPSANAVVARGSDINRISDVASPLSAIQRSSGHTKMSSDSGSSSLSAIAVRKRAGLGNAIVTSGSHFGPGGSFAQPSGSSHKSPKSVRDTPFTPIQQSSANTPRFSSEQVPQSSVLDSPTSEPKPLEVSTANAASFLGSGQHSAASTTSILSGMLNKSVKREEVSGTVGRNTASTDPKSPSLHVDTTMSNNEPLPYDMKRSSSNESPLLTAESKLKSAYSPTDLNASDRSSSQASTLSRSKNVVGGLTSTFTNFFSWKSHSQQPSTAGVSADESSSLAMNTKEIDATSGNGSPATQDPSQTSAKLNTKSENKEDVGSIVSSRISSSRSQNSHVEDAKTAFDDGSKQPSPITVDKKLESTTFAEEDNTRVAKGIYLPPPRNPNARRIPSQDRSGLHSNYQDHDRVTYASPQRSYMYYFKKSKLRNYKEFKDDEKNFRLENFNYSKGYNYEKYSNFHTNRNRNYGYQDYRNFQTSPRRDYANFTHEDRRGRPDKHPAKYSLNYANFNDGRHNLDSHTRSIGTGANSSPSAAGYSNVGGRRNHVGNQNYEPRHTAGTVSNKASYSHFRDYNLQRGQNQSPVVTNTAYNRFKEGSAMGGSLNSLSTSSRLRDESIELQFPDDLRGASSRIGYVNYVPLKPPADNEIDRPPYCASTSKLGGQSSALDVPGSKSPLPQDRQGNRSHRRSKSGSSLQSVLDIPDWRSGAASNASSVQNSSVSSTPYFTPRSVSPQRALRQLPPDSEQLLSRSARQQPQQQQQQQQQQQHQQQQHQQQQQRSQSPPHAQQEGRQADNNNSSSHDVLSASSNGLASAGVSSIGNGGYPFPVLSQSSSSAYRIPKTDSYASPTGNQPLSHSPEDLFLLKAGQSTFIQPYVSTPLSTSTRSNSAGPMADKLSMPWRTTMASITSSKSNLSLNMNRNSNQFSGTKIVTTRGVSNNTSVSPNSGSCTSQAYDGHDNPALSASFPASPNTQPDIHSWWRSKPSTPAVQPTYQPARPFEMASARRSSYGGSPTLSKSLPTSKFMAPDYAHFNNGGGGGGSGNNGFSALYDKAVQKDGHIRRGTRDRSDDRI